MTELSMVQRGALVTWWLLTEGPMLPDTLAVRLDERPPRMWKLLNEVGGSIPLVNDRGYWYIDTAGLTDLRGILDLTNNLLQETSINALYVRPMKRTDVQRINLLCRTLLRLTTAHPVSLR